MKKILFASMIFSFVFVASSIVFAETQDVEKKIYLIQDKPMGTTTPEQKKVQNNKTSQSTKDKKIVETPNLIVNKLSDGQIQEKILNPKEIINFEKIKKIGNSLYGVRKKGEPKPTFISQEIAMCVKNATNKKGSSTRAAMVSRNQAVLNAADDGLACALGAIDKTTATEQHETDQQCIATEQKTKDASQMAFEKLMQSIRATFQVDLKACMTAQLSTDSASTTPVK